MSLVASSVILGGLLSLFIVADQAARGNAGDVFASATDYNLDRVLSEIASSTSAAGSSPSRQAFANTGSENGPDAAGSPNVILVYDRTRNLVSTAYWSIAQGGPGIGTPASMPDYAAHPYPVFLNPVRPPAGAFGSATNMTNADVNRKNFAENWLTGIVALYRRDFDANTGRFRTGILWHAEINMARMSGLYALPKSLNPNEKGGAGGGGLPDSVASAAALNTLINRVNPHLMFAGARVLGVGIQTFNVNAGDPMSWTVTR